MSRFYKFAIGDVVDLRTRLHSSAHKAITDVEQMVNDLADTVSSARRLESKTVESASVATANTVAVRALDARDEYWGDVGLEPEGSAVDAITGTLRETVVKQLAEVCAQQVDNINKGWKDMLPFLITKYHDGYIANNRDQRDISMQKMFYPKWWLKMTGYFLEPPAEGDDVIMFEPSPFQFQEDKALAQDSLENKNGIEGAETEVAASGGDYSALLVIILFSAASLFAGFYFGRKAGMCEFSDGATQGEGEGELNFSGSMAVNNSTINTLNSSSALNKTSRTARLPGQMLQQMVPLGRGGYTTIAEEEA